MPTTGATGTSPFVAGDVVFRPREFTTAITNDWTTVPYCDNDFGNYSDPAVDHLTTVHNPVLGIGDICRHMGVVDGSTWRMPTAAEWEELYREQKPEGEARRIDNNSDWSPGLFAPLHGYAFGPHQSIVTIVSDAEVANANPYINGTVFFPTSGWRNFTDGAICDIGYQGTYWSSTAFTHANSLLMKFYSTNVLPQYSDVRTYGLSIRCIRE